MNEPTEGVCGDSGLILMVDPCYIFTQKEWSKICHRAHGGAKEVPIETCILEALKLKKKGEERTSAVVRTTAHGDGKYDVQRTSDGLVICGA